MIILHCNDKKCQVTLKFVNYTHVYKFGNRLFVLIQSQFQFQFQFQIQFFSFSFSFSFSFKNNYHKQIFLLILSLPGHSHSHKMTLVPHTELEDEVLKSKASNLLAQHANTTHVYVNPKTGFMRRFENLGLGFGGLLRSEIPGCTPAMLRDNPKRCTPLKGSGVSRRCPNTDRVK